MAHKLILISLAAVFAAATPAMASDRDYNRYQDDRGYSYDRDGDYRYDDRRFDDRRFDARRYDARYYDDRGYRNRDSRYYGGRRNNRYEGRRFENRCRDNGTGGTVIGALAGGLLGNQVAGRGDRLLGTIIGGGAGALAGRAIDRSDGRRC